MSQTFQQEDIKVEMVGTVSTPEEVHAVLDAAALRDDLPDNFHKLPFRQRQEMLGLVEPPE